MLSLRAYTKRFTDVRFTEPACSLPAQALLADRRRGKLPIRTHPISGTRRKFRRAYLVRFLRTRANTAESLLIPTGWSGDSLYVCAGLAGRPISLCRIRRNQRSLRRRRSRRQAQPRRSALRRVGAVGTAKTLGRRRRTRMPRAGKPNRADKICCHSSLLGSSSATVGRRRPHDLWRLRLHLPPPPAAQRTK